MSVKSNYFKMNKNEFDSFLDGLKKSVSTLHLLDNKFFYVPNNDSLLSIIDLHVKMKEFDFFVNSFSEFSKNQIIQSFLLDEIQATNKIENIFSTRHDIFGIINNMSLCNNKKIISISNAYKHLLETRGQNITKVGDIRDLYDIILKNSIDKEDLPDGKVFRKNAVFISDCIKNVHSGVNDENNIIRLMEEFINLYNSKNEIFIKMILCHFIFEYIHPFYDGNGRIGRFMFSNGLYLSVDTYFAFLISSSFEHEKNKYYKAFKEANDKYEFGCLNSFVQTILEILINQIANKIKILKIKKEKIECVNYPFKMSKAEQKVYKLIYESTLFSTFGVSNQEIMKEIGLSKRSLIYALNKLKNKNLLNITKIGKYNYYKLIK